MSDAFMILYHTHFSKLFSNVFSGQECVCIEEEVSTKTSYRFCLAKEDSNLLRATGHDTMHWF